MGRNGVLGQLRGIDAFGKTMDDVRIRTNVGALITLVSFALITFLTLGELVDYRKVHVKNSLVVDKSRGEMLEVAINVTFPRVPCYLLSLDVMDISGEHHDDIRHDITRTRLSHDGKVVEVKGGLQGEAARLAKQMDKTKCGSCYGGEPEKPGGCCNTCDEVRDAYARKGWSFTDPDHIDQCISEHWSEKIAEQNKEGCNLAGKLHVNKVVGNFHFSPGRAFQRNNMHVHDLVPYLSGTGATHHDFGHAIHELSFGSHDEMIEDLVHPNRKQGHRYVKKRLGIVDPLTGVWAHSERSQFMFQYFIKVVPTEYHTLNGDKLKTHQYSVTSYERDLDPGANAAAAAADGAKKDAAIKKQQQEHHPVQHGFMGIPGVYINVDPSALRIIHTEHRQTLAHFLTSTCAIVGGILTIAALVDQLLWQARIRLSASSSTTPPGSAGLGYGGGAYGGAGTKFV